MRNEAAPVLAGKEVMQRRSLLGLVLAVALMGHPAFAKDFTEHVLEQLQDQGFGAIQVERTLLGRTRILADSGTGRREIILNPRTGEILRDLWIPASGGGRSGGLIRDAEADDSGRGRGRGRGGDDDEEEEEDEEDDDDSSGGSDGEDNSGKGGGSDDDD